MFLLLLINSIWTRINLTDNVWYTRKMQDKAVRAFNAQLQEDDKQPFSLPFSELLDRDVKDVDEWKLQGII